MQPIYIPMPHVSVKSAGTDKLVAGFLVAMPDNDRLCLVYKYPQAGGSHPVRVTYIGASQDAEVARKLRSGRANWAVSKHRVGGKDGSYTVPKAARTAVIESLPEGARLATPKEMRAADARREERSARMSRLAAMLTDAPPALPSERRVWVSDGVSSKSEVSFSEAVAQASENPEVLVWERGMVAWTPARDVADLQAALAVSAPPALPTGNPVMDAALASAAHADADAAAANS